MTRPKALLSWSSGKDSAWALHVVRQRGDVDVVGLVTTIDAQRARVAMHAVREELLEKQAAAIGLPLWKVSIPWPCSNEQYEAAMGETVRRAAREGVRQMLFGDLFLRDIRAYREAKLAGTGVEPQFPLWERPTAQLAREMIAGGLRAVLTCVDPRVMPREAAGAQFHELKLPPGVDPCGENGEFHTFCHAAPDFRLDVRTGDVVERDGFLFADVIPP